MPGSVYWGPPNKSALEHKAGLPRWALREVAGTLLRGQVIYTSYMQVSSLENESCNTKCWYPEPSYPRLAERPSWSPGDRPRLEMPSVLSGPSPGRDTED